MENQEKKTVAVFGFTRFAENWNGRLAMTGFLIGVLTEIITGEGIISQLSKIYFQ